MHTKTRAHTYIKRYYPILFLAIVIVLWFPLTTSWSDFHGHVDSLQPPLENLYDSEQHRPFFLLPWAISLLYPFTFISLQSGWLIYNLISLGLILIVIYQFDPYPNGLTLTICFLNLPFILYASIGQWEGLMLGFLALAIYSIKEKRPILLGVSLLLLTTKPIHIWLVGLVLLKQVYHRWKVANLLYILTVPIIALLISFISLGNWPVRYRSFIQTTPPQTIHALDFRGGVSLSLEPLAAPLWLLFLVGAIYIAYFIRAHNTKLPLLVATTLCANLIINSYLQVYHFVLLIPPIVILCQYSRPMRIGVILYISSIPLQLFWVNGIALIYAPFIFFLLMVYSQRHDLLRQRLQRSDERDLLLRLED